jgi:hypothetical protein
VQRFFDTRARLLDVAVDINTEEELLFPKHDGAHKGVSPLGHF